MRRFTIPLSLLVAISSSILFGQDLRVSPLFLKNPERVEVLLEPLRNSEQIRSSLASIQSGELSLLEDGTPTVQAQSFKPFSATGQGMAVVLALDVSGSMKGRPLEEMKKALASFVKSMGPNDRLALISFADDIRVEVPFEAPQSDLLARIAAIQTRGTITELYKGLFKCLSLFETAGLPIRKRVVILTDGKDEGAAYTLEDALNRARERGVPVDSVGVTRINPKYLSICERLSDLTGGRYINATRIADLEGLLVQAALIFQSDQVAVFPPAHLRPDGKEHRIGVRYRWADQRIEGEANVALPNAGKEPGGEGKPGRRRLNWALGFIGILAITVTTILVSKRSPKPQELDSEDLTSSGILPEQGNPPRLMEAVNPSPGPGLGIPPLQPKRVPIGEMAESSSARKTGRKTVFLPDVKFPIPAPGQPAALLKAESGPCIGQAFTIEADPCWIGSVEEASICISGDSYLSGYHAYIRWQVGLLYLFDNHSTNGTFKNGVQVVDTSVLLSPGDKIRAGQTIFEVHSS